MNAIQARAYGEDGPWVLLIHGGPGAPGYLAPLGRHLSRCFQVLEPYQRGSGPEPLTVRRHLQDLDWLIRTRCGDCRPALVGHSWGAMLALAYAAAHPVRVNSVVLVACGTFDSRSRQELLRSVEARMTPRLRSKIEQLPGTIQDPDERWAELGRLLLPLYSHDPISKQMEMGRCDAQAAEESWQDMLRLQTAGVYPESFAAIEVPVLMLHGSDDPHPGPSIRATLERYLPQLEYREWARCGHYPWLEKAARDQFLGVLTRWLSKRLVHD